MAIHIDGIIRIFRLDRRIRSRSQFDSRLILGEFITDIRRIPDLHDTAIEVLAIRALITCHDRRKGFLLLVFRINRRGSAIRFILSLSIGSGKFHSPGDLGSRSRRQPFRNLENAGEIALCLVIGIVQLVRHRLEKGADRFLFAKSIIGDAIPIRDQCDPRAGLCAGDSHIAAIHLRQVIGIMLVQDRSISAELIELDISRIPGHVDHAADASRNAADELSHMGIPGIFPGRSIRKHQAVRAAGPVHSTCPDGIFPIQVHIQLSIALRHIARPYGRRISRISDGQDAIRTDSAQSIRMNSPCIDADRTTRHVETSLCINMSQCFQIDSVRSFRLSSHLYTDGISLGIGCLYMKGTILGRHIVAHAFDPCYSFIETLFSTVDMYIQLMICQVHLDVQISIGITGSIDSTGVRHFPALRNLKLGILTENEVLAVLLHTCIGIGCIIFIRSKTFWSIQRCDK